MLNTATPKEGDGATIGIGSDCYPATVIEVSPNGKTVTVQYDFATPIKNFDFYGNQVYSFECNRNGAIEVWTLRNHGRYARKGLKKGSGFYISFNGRRKYTDPSF